MHPHANTTHGNARRGKRTKAYRAWLSMRVRCRFPSQDSYPLYGGRGIKVCPEWESSFEAFLAHIGEPPSAAHTLDRIDNNRNYEPGNVRWADAGEQARNRRSTSAITFQGETLCLEAWAERVGIKAKTLRARIFDHGWSVERALTEAIISPQNLRSQATC